MKADLSRCQARIAFRFDAGLRPGMGHLFRCLSVAEALRDKADCLLVSNSRSTIVSKLVRSRGFRLQHLPSNGYQEEELAATTLLLKKSRVGLLVTDCPDLPENFLSALRALMPEVKIVAFDDRSIRRPVADIVIQPHVVRSWKLSRHDVGTMRLYSGPSYWILRAAFDPFLTGPPRKPVRRVKRVLVTMGGSDYHGATIEAARIVAETLPHALIDVVCGPAFRHLERLKRELRDQASRVLVHSMPTHLEAMMADADLAVAAGGYTVYELAALGVPTIILPLVEHQDETAREFERLACARATRLFTSLEKESLVRHLIDLDAQPQTRLRMSLAGRSLIDGRGRQRVRAILLSALRQESFEVGDAE